MFRALLLLAIAAGLVLATPAQADVRSSPVPDRTASANGRVNAILQVAGKIYIGGSFTSITRRDGTSVSRHRLAAIDAATGDLAAWNPGANGPVLALAASPDGSRIFAGGDFTSVGGERRSRLAKIEARSAAVSFWSPPVSGSVRALVVAQGRLYVGGRFSTISGSSTPRLAALDLDSGAVVAGFDPEPDGGIRALSVSSDGSTIYAGGSFVTIGGARRPYLAALSASTGRATGWQPRASRVVMALAVNGSRVFTGAAGSGGQLAAYDGGGGRPRWKRDFDGDVVAVVATSDAVYAGGHFHHAGGSDRERLAAFDPVTGQLDPWNPGANSESGIYSLAATSNRLYAGGDFTVIGGRPQPRLARFSG
jgi:hypothetical protein